MYVTRGYFSRKLSLFFFALSKRNSQTENYQDMLVKRLISLKYFIYLQKDIVSVLLL